MPVSLNGGYIMPAWYDVRHTDLGIEHDGEGIARSARQIRMLIEQEQMRGIQANRIIVAGFSQGAAMALHVGLTHPETLAGIIALSGYLLQPEKLEAARAKANQHAPIFMAHGVEDSVVPFGLGEQAARTLSTWGHEVAWHAYPMAHHVCPDEIRAIGCWIVERLGQAA
jgi:phospholipase/carboxylesterase